ncbi:hypothetical protein F5Y14DRAFT_450687 [Nemania sp. NC0429]|nr:hypothetical protein F5Y14DRAFT_450687 [Nemania sp. NC0429]
MSSPDQPDISSAGPPVNARNSWVIDHARELIGYDHYNAILQWLDDVPNDADKFALHRGEDGANDVNDDVGCASSSKSSHSSVVGDHYEYDQDCAVFSQKSIIERLEEAAAALEVTLFGGDGGSDGDDEEEEEEEEEGEGEDEDESCDTESFVMALESEAGTHVSSYTLPTLDLGSPTYEALASDSGSSDYQSLPSGSLDGEPLLGKQEETKSGSEADSWDIVPAPAQLLSTTEPLPRQQRTDLDLAPENEAQNEVGTSPGNEAQDNDVGTTRTRSGSKSGMLRSLSKLFVSFKPTISPKSPEFKLKMKMKMTTKSSKSQRNHLKKRPQAYVTNAYPLAYPEIERCASPFPSMRPPHPPPSASPLPRPSTPEPAQTLTPPISISPRLPLFRAIPSPTHTGIFRATRAPTPPNASTNANSIAARIFGASGNTTSTNTNALNTNTLVPTPTPTPNPQARPSTPFIRLSVHGGEVPRETETEIVHPVPQMAGRLFVPVPVSVTGPSSRARFPASPFATTFRRVPIVSLSGVEEEGSKCDELD